ncbi:MAG TPA: peptidoglycan-binding domain-containing protein [Candidatus Thiothrix moscowensis]|uniref:peptidoglycan-binding domain-containing protein n=1 Tax=unclassified Thiothrix TaxID=2636184 RepID=UPI0025D78C62|nr:MULTISPECIES: peptidoglycan-binding domain-containing protein [unclassified Thiothrix]HRJ52828.1 peptidoglycan-binding domain-containing protein [Candidatus Thiothrix moscowensis]HRJ94403.1 peptidoglycan-binding domain-containing protein [Candidatus Thiothrix moscowensis]
MAFQDMALRKAFPNGLQGELALGANGTGVVAVQYGLGRLGHLHDLCDGRFGPNTENAVKAFQAAVSIPATGKVTGILLTLLDIAVARVEWRTPAMKALDPLAYLSDFRSLAMPEIRIVGTREIYNWASPEIQLAYGNWLGSYWEVIKQNRVEADCKGMALFLMEQFRQQIRQDRFINLPHPVLRGARERSWIVATRDKTRGFFSRSDNSARINRTGYEAVLNVEKLDPQQSMLIGVAVHYPEISAHQVARSCARVWDWNPAFHNGGDTRKPEVPVNTLQPGHLIFIDHTGNGSFDHTVNVIRVERDSANRTRKLVMAVGSFDDVRDNSSDTEPNSLSQINTYSEEVTVELDANGRVINSTVSWSSEPDYLVKTRYSARTTLMEQKGGGKLFIGRWA